MSNIYFEFKQFTVWQDKCAMKVGTDGVLLGAWVNIATAKNILDVGAGTGLITLMLAQRQRQAIITAVEIDELTASQAKENVNHSPWKDQIKVVRLDFRFYDSVYKYDLIVSNPPYFINALKCPDKQRNTARHAGELNYELLFQRSAELLKEEGNLAIIIPAEAEKAVINIAWKYKLYPQHLLKVFTKAGKPCRRVLLSFGFQERQCSEKEICIQLDTNEFSSEYKSLVKDFYLKF